MLLVHRRWNGAEMLEIYRNVPDSANGMPTTIVARHYLPPFPGDIAGAAVIYRFINESLAHEIGHALRLDGVPIFDPHRFD